MLWWKISSHAASISSQQKLNVVVMNLNSLNIRLFFTLFWAFVALHFKIYSIIKVSNMTNESTNTSQMQQHKTEARQYSFMLNSPAARRPSWRLSLSRLLGQPLFSPVMASIRSCSACFRCSVAFLVQITATSLWLLFPKILKEAAVKCWETTRFSVTIWSIGSDLMTVSYSH